MPTPRDAVLAAERNAAILPGANERFSGWGLMGLPFRSGHVLATRRFPASSVGAGYTSVWHRDPGGAWTLYADTPPETACTRYFGMAVSHAVQCPIDIEWPSPNELHINVRDYGLSCDVVIAPTVASRLMNTVAATFPERAWRSPRMLQLTGRMAAPLLGAGRLSMVGRAPNGQLFIANPRRIWVVQSARLTVGGREAGPPGPVTPQARLGDFLIPQRGLLAIGNAVFDTFDPSRHSTATAGAQKAPPLTTL